jgi:hypothetical protein
MTGRPPRDVRAAALDRITSLLHRAQHPTPDAFALEILTCLDGIHIGLTDTTPPTDPNADAFTRPDHTIPAATAQAPTPGLAEYLAAKHNRPTTPTHRTPKGQQ